MNPRAKISLISTIDAGIIILLIFSGYWMGEKAAIPITYSVFWASLSFIASIMGTRLPLGRAIVSIGEPIDIAGIIIVGPFPIIIANVVALLVNAITEGRERFKKLPFNIVLWVLAPLLSGWVLSVITTDNMFAINTSTVIAIICMYIVYSITLFTHVAAAISISDNISYKKVIIKNYTYPEIASLSMMPIAIIMVILWSDHGAMGVVLLLIPIALMTIGLKYAFERGRLEERIRKENQITEFGKIAASVLHEISRPISRIVMEAEQVREVTEDKQQILHLSNIVNWAKDAGNMTREMFAGFARQIQLSKITVDKIMQSAIAILPENEKHRVSISINSTIRCVNWDAKKIELVISNLLINALESSTTEDIIIRVNTVKKGLFLSRKPHMIVISVSDQGEGLPSGPIAKIFDPLFSTKMGGKGMGLFLSKQIALAHGGDLNAVPGVPRGAEFLLRLPIDSAKSLSE
ncbi:sensor histidine kinase [Gemmatimonadota bacterium]